MEEITLDINSKVLNSAFVNSGYRAEEVVSKIKTKKFTVCRFLSILKGEIKPTVGEIKKLDLLFKRGIPFYFLPDVPPENYKLSFRKGLEDVSPADRVVIRDYEFVRNDLKYLLDDLGVDYSRKTPTFEIKSDPSKVADSFRLAWKYEKNNIAKMSSTEVFSFIREKIEGENIFVFKRDFYRYKNVNFSGCIFLRENLPILIFVNSKDDKNRDIFTLLHEFAHYLLDKEENYEINYNFLLEDSIERWCNAFAYSFMINVRNEEDEGFEIKKKETLISDHKLIELSEKYKVSKLALMYRYLILRIITPEEFHKYASHYSNSNKIDKEITKDLRLKYALMMRFILSKRFVELVAKNYSKGNISYGEALNLVKAKTKPHFEEIIGGLMS